MIRRAIRSILRIVLRVFFPQIELSGLDRVPREGPVILAVNHPNGLIDPIFLLCLSPRPVSFLAKAPLFDMPVIGWFVRALGSIPVYRRQDGGFDPAKNRQTFDRARAILSGGGVIAIFPEGASHGDPRLRPLKTGAARIALGATSSALEQSLSIVPLGIYYTAKRIFRSSALLYFGEPISVARAPLNPDGEPPPDAVRSLTDQIERALHNVTLQADEHEALTLVGRAEEMFSADDPADENRLVAKFQLRRRLMAGYTTLRARAPERLANLSGRINRFEIELRDAGLDPKSLQPENLISGGVAALTLKGLVFLIFVVPLALVGTVINYPAYRLVAFIATGLSKNDEDIVATIKMIAGTLLFPLTWILVAVAIGGLWGMAAGFAGLVIGPLTGYASLRFFETLDELAGGARAVLLSRFRRWGYLRLVAERSAIREEIISLGAELERQSS